MSNEQILFAIGVDEQTTSFAGKMDIKAGLRRARVQEGWFGEESRGCVIEVP